MVRSVLRDVLVVFAAGAATMFATGLGAIPVFLLGERAARMQPLLWGIAAGMMGVASIVGLTLPALDEGSALSVAIGLALGVAFLFVARAFIDARFAHHHALDPAEALRSSNRRAAALVFLVLLVHSLPEGFAIGAAYGAERAGLGLFVIVALAVHNIPEGTAAAIPLHAAGASRTRQFWSAVATSIPQPVGAVIAFLLVEQIDALLAVALAFAAGAMLALVAVEMAPKALSRGGRASGVVGAIAGALVIFALSAWLGV